MPSEMQLTTTGNKMTVEETVEEHVATAKTHLRYGEGLLQPSASIWRMRRYT
jgi:hypothetical protein